MGRGRKGVLSTSKRNHNKKEEICSSVENGKETFEISMHFIELLKTMDLKELTDLIIKKLA